MKILCVWLKDYISMSYEQTHYFPALKNLGHRAEVLPINKFTEERILDIVKAWRPELAIFKLYRNNIRYELISHITNKTRTTTLTIQGDDEKYFDIDKQWDSLHAAPHFDYIVTTCPEAPEAYHKFGIKNVIYSQYGANHEYCKRSKCKKEIDVTFLGTRKWNRVELFNYLADNKVNLMVYGMGWVGDDRILTPEDYIYMMNKTKINLNTQIDIFDDNGDDLVVGKKTLQIKGRDFEVPMTGGFLLTNYNENLKEFFKFGKEIETYKDKEECLSKINFYLKHDNKRQTIANAGYKRARKDHTYKKRFKQIIEQVRLKHG